MGRKSKHSDRLETRLEAGVKPKLAAIAISLGYTYTRDGKVLPLWSEYLKAIATGEIKQYKEVKVTLDNDE